MNIIYFGYDIYVDCLCMLLENSSFTVHNVYTFPPDCLVESHLQLNAVAGRYGIPITEAPPSLKELETFFRIHPDGLAVCAGYTWRIPVERVAGFRGINLHPAILPDGRGPWPFPYVILKGYRESGVTVHKLAADFDQGDILAQVVFPVTEDETLITLTEKSQKVAPPLLLHCLQNLPCLWEEALPQHEGSYWPDRSDEDRMIRPDMTIEETDRRLRAFAGYGALACFPCGEFLIADGCVRMDIIGPPGTLQKRNDGSWVAAVKDGSLWFNT